MLGYFVKAEEILEKLQKAIPESVHVISRRVNLARRQGDMNKMVQVFEQFIEASKDKEIVAHITIKYARFLWKVSSNSSIVVVVALSFFFFGTVCRLRLHFVFYIFFRALVTSKKRNQSFHRLLMLMR